MLRQKIGLLAAVMLLWACNLAGAAEFRAFWADAWHAGFKNTSQVTTMVNTAKNNNYNVILVQVRKRGDCYYFPTAPNTEPRATDISSTYDPLSDVITQAHAQGLKVYAWVTAQLVWSDTGAPSSSAHVYNAHPEWLMKDSSGDTYIGEGYYLDPGVPAAQDWNLNVCMDLVQHYNIDGLQLDYIRYPQQDSGYNTTAIARFNAEYGRSGNPSPSDSQFSTWRRKQISNFVRRVYASALAVKPNLVICASTFGSRSDAYSNRFQDWAGWMSAHILDANMPMNYVADNYTFNSRVDDAYNYRYGRHLYMGQGSYLNTIANSMAQLAYARSKGCEGLITYSYQATNNQGAANSTFYSNVLSQVFTSADTLPTMSWKSSPTYGILKGVVTRGSDGSALCNSTITINGKTALTDGSGFYAVMDVTPGTYSTTCSASGYNSTSGSATISAGQVATLNFTMGTDVTPPTISGVAATNTQGTYTNIVWNTNEAATSQVEYGLTTSYGSSTTLDTTLVSSHSVILASLTPNTTYHYRVKSRDGGANQRVSGDYTFTTGASDTVADIIIDNDDATRVTLVGSWSTGSGATDKYGANYYYATTAASETKSCKWTPSILTAGSYKVYVWYSQGSNRSIRAPYTVNYNGGSQTFQINQQSNGGQWVQLGTGSFNFAVGTAGYVKLGNGTNETSINVVADAVKFEYDPGDIQAPSVPTGLAGAASSMTAINLSWNASTDNVGVVGYNVYRDGVMIGSTANTNFADSDLNPGTAYAYQVEAYDAASNTSAKCAVVSASTLSDTQAPSVPTGLAATPSSPYQVDLSWNDSADNLSVAGYNVFRNGTLVGNTTVAGYTDNGLSPNTSYSYTVSAYDDAGNVSARCSAVSATTLAETGNIHGAVTDSDTGAALAGASVMLNTGASTTTDSAGNYAFDGLAVGTYTVTASLANYTDQSQGASVSAGNTTTLNFSLVGQKGNLVGIISNSVTAAPIVGAVCTLNTGVQVTTNSAGKYTFTGLTVGTYTVTVTMTGYESNSKSRTISAGIDNWNSMTLVPHGSISGQITNSGTGVGISGATVSLNTGASTTTNASGNYSFADLAAGTYTVSASATNYVSNSASATVSAGSATTTNIALTVIPTDTIIDNTDTSFTVSTGWTSGTSATDKYGTSYVYATTATSETRWARWTPDLPVAGNYAVYVWYSQGSNRSTKAPYTVYYNGGSQTFSINQTSGGGQWVRLGTGTFSFSAGSAGYVKLGNNTSENSKVVLADAVKFVRQ